jgi:polar amino acid transport system substrate-binding protein
MKMRYILTTVAILIAMIFSMNSCGSSNTETSGDHLTILTEEYAPANFTKDGKLTGQATEVVEELLKRSGTDATINVVPWEEGYKAVLEQPNTALFITAMTPERKDHLQWVGPVTTLDSNFYALQGSGIVIKTLDDAKKVVSIATVPDYYTEQVLKNEGFTNLQSYPNDQEALQKLLSGEVQLYITTNIVLPALLENADAVMDDVENVFSVSTDLAYIAFSLTTPPELVARWQSELDGMKRDGSFNKIYAKWLPSEMPPGIFQMMTEEYPPITFMDEGKPSGFVTEMVQEIASRLDIPDNIRLTSWKNAYNMALLHPNVILFSAERTLEREELFHWVGPVGKNNSNFYAKKGSEIVIETLDDAKKVVSSADPAESVHLLMDGKVDLSMFTDLTIPEIVKNAGYSMDDLEPLYTAIHTYFYIALSKDTSQEVSLAWQSTLNDMKEDGTFEEIYQRYLPDTDLDDLLKE